MLRFRTGVRIDLPSQGTDRVRTEVVFAAEEVRGKHRRAVVTIAPSPPTGSGERIESLSRILIRQASLRSDRLCRDAAPLRGTRPRQARLRHPEKPQRAQPHPDQGMPSVESLSHRSLLEGHNDLTAPAPRNAQALRK